MYVRFYIPIRYFVKLLCLRYYDGGIDGGIYVINTTTGEIINEILPGDRIVRKSSIDYLMKKQNSVPHFDGEKFDMYKASDFTKIVDKNMRNTDFTEQEAYLMLKLSSYVPYNGMALCHDNGKPMTKKQIVDVLGWSTSKFEHVLKEASKKNIFKSVRNDVTKKYEYFLNPLLFMRGVQIDKNVRKMFE